MLNRIIDLDIILGNNASNYNERQKQWALEAAKCEVEAYIGRPVYFTSYNYSPPDICEEYTPPLVKNTIGNAALISAILDIAVIKLYRLGTEAVTSQSFSGVSESFLTDYPAHIISTLKRFRKIKVVG